MDGVLLFGVFFCVAGAWGLVSWFCFGVGGGGVERYGGGYGGVDEGVGGRGFRFRGGGLLREV